MRIHGNFTVSFFGHRQINGFNDVEHKLEDIVENCICENNFVTFLVGRNGEFDNLVSQTIHKFKKEHDDERISHELVLPYYTAEYINNSVTFEEYYDDIYVYDEKYFKSAFDFRNKRMIDESDLAVFYIEHNYGGAYQAYKYARSKNKKCINIFNDKFA